MRTSMKVTLFNVSCRYEDDGISTAYLHGATSATAYSYAPISGSPECTSHSISTSGAGYDGLVTTRNYTITLLSSCGNDQAPASVTANGAHVPQSSIDGVPGSWFFDGYDTRITLLPCDVNVVQNVTVCCSSSRSL